MRPACVLGVLLLAACGGAATPPTPTTGDDTCSGGYGGRSPQTDEAALQAECPRAGAGRCQALVLRNVCLVQETFVMFDADTADAHPDGTHAFPDLDVTGMPYWYRHASPEQVDAVTHATSHPHAHPSTVLGHQIKYAPIGARFAAANELDASPTFDNCTTPVIVYSQWIMNYAESYIRVPTLLNKLKNVLGGGATLAPATPLKLPLDRFNKIQLAPFSKHKPVSFAELSALRRHNFSEHEACFSQVVVLKITSGAYAELPVAADAIAAYYEPFPASPWRSTGDEVTRIVFESRPNRGMRQFINLNETLAACKENQQLECKRHTFGDEFKADVALMREADVLVAYHGAGEMNSLYMKPHSAILEIRGRGFGTTHGWWPAFWWYGSLEMCTLAHILTITFVPL
jgi:hypothetical protein